jgi:hypothetical protein
MKEKLKQALKLATLVSNLQIKNGVYADTDDEDEVPIIKRELSCYAEYAVELFTIIQEMCMDDIIESRNSDLSELTGGQTWEEGLRECIGRSIMDMNNPNATNAIIAYVKQHLPLLPNTPQPTNDGVKALKAFHNRVEDAKKGAQSVKDLLFLNGIQAMLDTDIEYLNQSPLLPNTVGGGWIKVEDRLPDTNKDVLATDVYDCMVCYYNGAEWRSYNEDKVMPKQVTHWQPLPPAPNQYNEG